MMWRSKKISLSILVSYYFLLIIAAIIYRSPTKDLRCEVVPFRILRAHSVGIIKDLLQQMFANIVMFIPIGIQLPFLTTRNPIFGGTILSLFLEVLQLVTHRGVFEIDDIIYNTCGAAIGVIMIRIIKELKMN